mgnify:CR=1 FL=1
MKKKALALVLCISMAAVMFTGCKTVVQNPTGTTPQVISPEVTIQQESKEEPNVINVSGSGEIKLVPDIATVSIQVRTYNEKPAAAQAENSAIMDAVIEAVKAAGVKDADIATDNVSLNERYNYKKTPAVVVGYDMVTSIKVTIRDIDAVGKVLSDTIAAGATGTLTVSDSSAAYQQALKAAIDDAKGKAQAIAEALGVTLKPIPSAVNEQSSSYTPNAAYDMRTASAAEDANADVSISPGELTVEAQVSIEYEIDTGADN